jgi:MYXO-CTERM domain-containing protein
MTHRTPKIRPATTAIAAVLALSATQLLAQTAPDATQPVMVAPTTAVMDSAPVATTPSEPLTTSTSDPLAPSAKSTATKSTKSTTTHRTASVVRPAKAAPPVAQAPVAAPAALPAETVEAAPITVTAGPAAAPAAVIAPPPAKNSSVASSDMLPIAGAAGLGFLGLLGVGLAVRRRRRRNEEEFAAAEQDELAVDAPAQADPLFDEPAFAPLSADPAPSLAQGAAVASAPASECADAAPGSHVEAACEGPTADNPSLSIKKRLKRAHFFDEREFLAEAGEVAPMAADAGLPDAITEPVAAPAPSTREPA